MVYAIRGLATTQAKQVDASCVNTYSWVDKITRESRHKWDLRHLLQNKFAPWASITCSTRTDFTAKRRTTLFFLQQFFATCNDLICCKAGWTWVVKRAISLFNSFSSNVALKQVARFCYLFFCTLKLMFCFSEVPWWYSRELLFL